MPSGPPSGPPSKGAFYQKVDQEFYAEVTRESGGTLPADLADADGKPRKLTTSPADAEYRKKWKDIAATLRDSKAVPEKEVDSPCVPCEITSPGAKIAPILLPSKSTGKPINIGTPGPVTGSPPYEPDRWNKDPVKSSTNCYAYAANDPDGHPPGKPQPGQHCGHPATEVSCAEDSRAAQCDGMIAAPDPPPPKPGYYPVALVADPGVDYHWYRLDSNGKWSHKPGSTNATNVDASGNLITDPKAANMDYSDRGGPNYKFCGYFYVPSAGLRTGNP